MSLSSERTVRRPMVVISTLGMSALAGVVGISSVTDPDVWWNLRAGQYLLDSHRFSGPDPWSAFTTRPFVLTEWLGDAIAASLYDAVGLAGIVWLRTLGVVIVAALLLLAARRVASSAPAVTAALIGLLAVSGSLTERPQTLSIAFLALSVLAWHRAAVHQRPSPWLIALSWLWACTHGYWIVGVGLGVATAVGSLCDQWSPVAARRFLAVVVGMVVAAGLTPVGPQLLLLPFRVHGAATTASLIGEWQPATVSQPHTALALGMAVTVALIWLVRPSTWSDRAQLTLALLMTLAYARTATAAACLLVPLLAKSLGALLGAPPERSSRLELRAGLVGAVAVLGLSAVLAPRLATTLQDTPDGLAPDLAKIPAGAVVLNDYNVSSWMLFHEPDLRLVIDSRTELYDDAYLERYLAAYRAQPGWDTFVTASGATYAVLASTSPMADALRERRHWSTVAQADGFTVLRAPS